MQLSNSWIFRGSTTLTIHPFFCTRRARKLVGKMQLDPNRWFRSGEMAMLQIVGQETVRYVSNINKYYVIYRHALIGLRNGKRQSSKLNISGGVDIRIVTIDYTPVSAS